MSLLPLLDYLATTPADGEWGGWHIWRIGGGANNRVYHAWGVSDADERGRTRMDGNPSASIRDRPRPISNSLTSYVARGALRRISADFRLPPADSPDLAIKWTIRDTRDRAGREYAALAALRAHGLALAPAPLLLERTRYPQPVVVQQWLAGAPLGAPPTTDQEWQALIEHYLAIHTLTPAHAAQPIQPAVLNMQSAADGLARIEQQLAAIPPADRPPDLAALAAAAVRRRWPCWAPPPLALCRADPNTSNFVRGPGGLASVDWENSGWGDPAFEIADLIAHPAYAGVPRERADWLSEAYADARRAPSAALRIRTYLPLMLVWWAARCARTLYEVPLGGDQRLAARPEGWQAAMQVQYARYLARAWAALGGEASGCDENSCGASSG